MKRLQLSQILVIVFAALVCISTILPAVTILGTSINLLAPGGEIGSGLFLLILSVLSALFALLAKRILCLVFAILNFLLAIFQMVSLGDYMQFATIGLYLMIIGSVLLLAAAIFMMKQLSNK